MLLKKLFQTRKADANLPSEIRAALIESLFAPIASLVVGAIACSIIGAAVAVREQSAQHWVGGAELGRYEWAFADEHLPLRGGLELRSHGLAWS